MGGRPAHLGTISYDWMEPARQVRVTIDQDKARLLGLSSRAIAEVVNTMMAGTSVTQVRDDIYLIPVIARAHRRAAQLAHHPAEPPAAAGRRAHGAPEPDRDLRLQAGVPADLAARPRADARRSGPTSQRCLPGQRGYRACPGDREVQSQSLPKDYRIAVGGSVEESANSQASVFAKVPLMLLLMLFFLMVAAAQLQPARSSSLSLSRWG